MPEEKKVEYADFSDMGKPSLPTEIEENPMESQHIAISYEDEESLKGQPQTEPDVAEPVQEVEDKSAKYWQSQYDKRERELQELRNQQQQGTQQFQNLQREIVTLREQLTPKPKEEVLVKPSRPNTDDPNVILQWQTDMIEYQDKVYQKQQEQIQRTNQAWEQETQRRQQQEQYAQFKAFQLSQLQGTGLSPEEANEAFVMYSKAQDNPTDYYKDLGDFYRFKKGQYGTPKGDQMGNRINRQGQVPPLANAPSEAGVQKKNPSDEFFGDMKQFIKRYY